MDDIAEQIVEFDPAVSAWRFHVELRLDGNTQCTFEGYRLSREAAREAIEQVRALGVAGLYQDKQRKSPW